MVLETSVQIDHGGLKRAILKHGTISTEHAAEAVYVAAGVVEFRASRRCDGEEGKETEAL